MDVVIEDYCIAGLKIQGDFRFFRVRIRGRGGFVRVKVFWP